MDIFFTDPSDVPLPPEEVRIREFWVDPYPDGHRVRVYLELTPFLKHPNGDIFITDSLGNRVASTSFIEAITPKLEMTMHLRSFDPAGQLTASVALYYTQEIEEEQQGERTLMRSEKFTVDHAETKFKIDD